MIAPRASCMPIGIKAGTSSLIKSSCIAPRRPSIPVGTRRPVITLVRPPTPWACWLALGTLGIRKPREACRSSSSERDAGPMRP
eukprot:5965953-Pyramimonas_sp.AAC.1